MSSPTTVMSAFNISDTTSLENSIPTRERMIEFVNSISDILNELSLTGFIKMLEICTRQAYQFSQRRPALSLADCMTEMIRDYRQIKDTNPKVGHFYQAMLFRFLQISIRHVDSEHPENADSLTEKIKTEWEAFKLL
jgi:hypothetical protein